MKLGKNPFGLCEAQLWQDISEMASDFKSFVASAVGLEDGPVITSLRR